MSLEMACGHCQGRFAAAATGTVACPHCGAHVSVSSNDFSAADVQPPQSEAEDLDPAPADAGALQPSGALFAGYAGLAADDSISPVDAVIATAAARADDDPAAEQDDSAGCDAPSPGAELETIALREPNGAAPAGEQQPEDELTVTLPPDDAGELEPEETLPDFSAFEENKSPAGEPSFDLGEPAPMISEAAAEPAAMNPAAASPAEVAGEIPDTLADAGDEPVQNELDAVLAAAATTATTVEAPPEPASEAHPAAEIPVRQPATGEAAGGVSRTWFLLLASYASAVTMICIWLLIQYFAGGGVQLQNLQDPAESRGNGEKKTVRLYAVNQALPWGHVLRLGESRRFGNILIEPQKVTRGPLEFVHFPQQDGTTKPPTAPVLKLWLRFENCSTDQTIAPLDAVLLYENRHRTKGNFDESRGNTFVCRAAEKNDPQRNVVYVYSLNMDDNWDLRGQQLPQLAAGESVVTYVPCGPAGIDELTGDLVWRVHVRKGYSPAGRGVTTLIEVNFNGGSIETEPSAKSNETTAAR